MFHGKVEGQLLMAHISTFINHNLYKRNIVKRLVELRTWSLNTLGKKEGHLFCLVNQQKVDLVVLRDGVG